MAVDMFLKLDGIKGESKDHKHADEIHVESFAWGATQSGTFGAGGGGGAGKVNFQDINFTKFVDVASPTLMLYCANGKHIPAGLLTVRKAGEKPLEYLKIKFSDIIVSSVQQAGHGAELITENLSLNFAKVEQEYVVQKEDGTPGGTSKAGWDLKQNVKI